MAPDSSLASLLILTALLLSFTLLAQTLSSYSSAYFDGPGEIAIFIDARDFSIQENEGYNLDIMKIRKVEDRFRLDPLYREIQKNGDNLREELNQLLIDGDKGGTTLRTSARFLWKMKRVSLQERVRRGDMLRMRFLAVYIGLVASNLSTPPMLKEEKSGWASEKAAPRPPPLPRPPLHHANTDGNMKRPPPVRRLNTQAMGHSESVGGHQRAGWHDLVQELQRSPQLQRRRESVELSIRQAQIQARADA